MRNSESKDRQRLIKWPISHTLLTMARLGERVAICLFILYKVTQNTPGIIMMKNHLSARKHTLTEREGERENYMRERERERERENYMR